MADIKITDLAAYTDPVSTDVLPIVDVGNDLTKKVSIADLLENAGTGTAAAPSFSFDGDNDTGLYQPGANQIAIATNGTQRLLVTSSGSAQFTGAVVYQNTSAPAGTTAFQVKDGSSTVFRVYANGETVIPNIAYFADGSTKCYANGNVDVGGSLVVGQNTTLAANGSASFTGSVTIDESPSSGQKGGQIKLGQVVNEPLATIFTTRVDGSYKGKLEFKTHQSQSNSLSTALTLTETQQALFPGPVSIGGTAAANTIDEYEEGTWTPNVTADNGSAQTAVVASSASYRRIGAIVTCYLQLDLDADDSTGSFRFSLPFTTGAGGSCNLTQTSFMKNDTVHGFISGSSMRCGFPADLTSGSKTYRGSFTYRIN